jgi:hypothetical protein
VPTDKYKEYKKKKIKVADKSMESIHMEYIYIYCRPIVVDSESERKGVARTVGRPGHHRNEPNK